jgi:DNA-directed RNA polymerase specialized sigma24 family protein
MKSPRALNERIEILDTETAFSVLLAKLSAVGEQDAAFEYERLRKKLENYFELKGLTAPREAADLTLDRVATLLNRESKIIDNVFTFAFGVARNVFREQLRLLDKERKLNQEYYQSVISSSSFDEEEFEIKERCLARLTNFERNILEEYYSEISPRERLLFKRKLAEKYGVELNNLRQIIHRIRRKLEDLVEEERKVNSRN